MSVVLDSSAILAIVLNEPGSQKVQEVLGNAAMSTVNLAEIYATATEKGLDVTGVRGAVAALGIRMVPFGEAHAFLAGQLRPLTRSHGLSLGDRACLATAMTEKRSVITADKAWLSLTLPVEIIAIR